MQVPCGHYLHTTAPDMLRLARQLQQQAGRHHCCRAAYAPLKLDCLHEFISMQGRKQAVKSASIYILMITLLFKLVLQLDHILYLSKERIRE